MGNFSGTLHLKNIFISKLNHKGGLVEMIRLDSDYEDDAENIADIIMKNYSTLEERVGAIFHALDDSLCEDCGQYILAHDGHVSSAKHEIIEIDNEQAIISIAYTT